nr:MAG TPA: hypothetical protein [Bacteriophage sp.]
MYIANVITNGSATGVTEMAERISNFENADMSKPTLIIGKKNAESIFGKENIKVLNRNIKDNVIWTYAKNERRDDYLEGIKNFNSFVFDALKQKVKYKYFDVFHTNYSTVRDFILYMGNKQRKVAYLKKEHIYFYTKNSVYGLDLRECEYLGIKKEKIINIIKNAKNISFVSNLEENSLELDEYLSSNAYLIPYIYYLKNC